MAKKIVPIDFFLKWSRIPSTDNSGKTKPKVYVYSYDGKCEQEGFTLAAWKQSRIEHGEACGWKYHGEASPLEARNTLNAEWQKEARQFSGHIVPAKRRGGG